MRDEQVGRSAALEEAVRCGADVCLAVDGGREAKADRISA